MELSRTHDRDLVVFGLDDVREGIMMRRLDYTWLPLSFVNKDLAPFLFADACLISTSLKHKDVPR